MTTHTKTILDNGLVVMLKEIHTAPIISHWIWYKVGSRDERSGSTGISHWVEHMQFKGTPQFSSRLLDKAISREGGFWNAFTYLDWTTYFETLPADKIDLALRLEADRMINSEFDPGEVASERTVVIAERQGNENEPLFRLDEEVVATAFHVHPYHHQVIGDMADLQQIQRDDLYSHYRTYYTPKNAILAIAGDFDTENMLGRIRQLYEGIPSGSEAPRLVRPENPQIGERRLTVEGPGATTYVQVSYHIPEAVHADFFPLAVLDSLLAGPSNLNMFGGGTSNKTSRLYRALVEGELVINVSGGMQATINPYLYHFVLTMHPQHTPDEALAVLQDQIKIIQDAPPPITELRRAVKQARAMFAYGSESITNQAFWLGYPEMFADYHWYLTYLDKLAAVTPEDVQRVAQLYFQPRNCTLGVYLPDDKNNRGGNA